MHRSWLFFVIKIINVLARTTEGWTFNIDIEKVGGSSTDGRPIHTENWTQKKYRGRESTIEGVVHAIEGAWP